MQASCSSKRVSDLLNARGIVALTVDPTGDLTPEAAFHVAYREGIATRRLPTDAPVLQRSL
jgi:hypothetical protein